MMNRSMTCEREIMIPGEDRGVSIKRFSGDMDSGIRFELLSNAPFLDKLPDAAKLRAHMSQGGRVFITELDEYLFLKPVRRRNALKKNSR